jgi:hypothetical protein
MPIHPSGFASPPLGPLFLGNGHVAGTFPPPMGGSQCRWPIGPEPDHLAVLAWHHRACRLQEGDFVPTPSRGFGTLCAHALPLWSCQQDASQKTRQETEAYADASSLQNTICLTEKIDANIAGSWGFLRDQTLHDSSPCVEQNESSERHDEGVLGMCSQKLGTRWRGGMTRDEGGWLGPRPTCRLRSQFSSFAGLCLLISGLLHATCRRASLDWLGLKCQCTGDWSGWETCSGDATLAKPRQCRRSARVPSLLSLAMRLAKPDRGGRQSGWVRPHPDAQSVGQVRRSAPCPPATRPAQRLPVCQRLAVSPSAMAVLSLSTMYAHRH